MNMRRRSLSASQQGLWFMSRIDDQVSAAYNVVLAFQADSTMDVDAVQRVLTVLQRRHESLRCRIVSELGVPAIEVQDQDEASPWQLERQEGELHAIARLEALRPFDMEVAPLARAVIVSSGPGPDGLIIAIPHVLFDDASARILIDDAQAIDLALRQRLEPATLVHMGSLLDAIDFERDRLDGPRIQGLADAAQRRLEGMAERLTLPGQASVGAGAPAHHGEVIEFELPPALSGALQGFVRRHRLTPAAVCLGAFQVTLWRISGQTDFGVSVAVSNRDSEALQRVVGYFTNLGVIRARIDPEMRIDEFLASLGEQWLDLLDERELPFVVLVKTLRRAGGNVQTALMQLGFNYLDEDSRKVQLGGTCLHPVQVVPPLVKNQLKLDLKQSGGSLRGMLLYDTVSIGRELARCLAETYQVLLEAMFVDESAKLRQLPLLTPEMRHRILVEWNETGPDVPLPGCIHELFEQQAARTPDAVALVDLDRQLTYRELNARANRLAHRLRDLGVQPDNLVAICLERSLELVVGLLGILKAGGAYVPLDPDYPEERLAFMLKDAGPSVVLTLNRPPSNLTSALATLARSPLVLDLADGASESAGPSSDDPPPAAALHHLAYVVYTSGSTGRPKGVLVEHRHVVRLFAATSSQYGFDAKDVWTLFHSFAFDFSVWEIWGALTFGGRLVVVPLQTARDADAFHELLCSRGVTVLNQTPSAFRALIAAQSRSTQTHSLRHVVFGGEALEFAMLKPWYKDPRNAKTRLANMYGITETTVHVTFLALSEADTEITKGSLIGSRIGDLRLYVLDACGQPVPVGVPGEIHVGGAGVARGYLNRHELTAERFLPSPFVPGDRLYRSGDLARYMSDGSLEFLGRIDDQVKIRGFRIELGEIESTIRSHHTVAEAVVVAQDRGPGDKRLVAYVVPNDKTVASTPALRSFLQGILPEYMLPTIWVFVDALPLTSNGKIDRAALPGPSDAGSDRYGYHVPPQTDVERRLSEIWAQVLGCPRVGAHDNFFALGGHSLLAMQLMARIEQEGFRRLPIKAIFDAPTVASFATMLESPGSTPVVSSAGPITRIRRRAPPA